MVERFHIIEDAAAILLSRGVYRQAKVFRRGDRLYASHGSGFIGLYRTGTSIPTISCEGFDTPGLATTFDALGRAVVKS
jgi:hypothetical protein